MKLATLESHKDILEECKKIFNHKMIDYGLSWFVLRLSSLTDQIMIKIFRIRSIQQKGTQYVTDNIYEDFIGIINYSIMALIRLEAGDQDLEMTEKEVFEKFDTFITEISKLLNIKNHDYGEAWKEMRLNSIVDIILMKLKRIKQLEDNGGLALYSEGISSGYKDIVNYAAFSLIILKERQSSETSEKKKSLK